MQLNNYYWNRQNSRWRRSHKSTQEVSVPNRASRCLNKSNSQHLLGSRRNTACSHTRLAEGARIQSRPFQFEGLRAYAPIHNLRAGVRLFKSTYPAAFCSHVPLPALHRGASLTSGSNRSLRSLGQAKACPLTKR
jgi:hypothetical protein